MENYPFNAGVKSKEPFVVNIVNPCDEPVSLDAPSELDRTVIDYALTSPPVMFTFDKFIQNPDWCDIEYKYQFLNVDIEQLFTSYDNENRTFTFEYSGNDLAPLNYDVDLEFRDFEVVISAKHGLKQPISREAVLTVRVRNPCFESSGIEERPEYCPILVVIDPVEENYLPAIPDWLANLTDLMMPIGLEERKTFELGALVNQYD